MSLTLKKGRNGVNFVEGDRIVGYSRIEDQGELRYISTFEIRPEYQGRNYGRRAAQLLKKNARRDGKELIAADVFPSAAGFWEKCGVKYFTDTI